MAALVILELAAIPPQKEESICILEFLVKVPTFTMIDLAQVMDNMLLGLSYSGLTPGAG